MNNGNNEINNTITRYSDLSLDFIPHPLTENLTPKKNLDSIKQSIKVLLRLESYDLPFNAAEMGNIRSFLFEDLNPILKISLKKTIEWLLSAYEKRIELNKIEIDIFDSGDGFSISIFYKIKALGINDIYFQNFQRIR